MNGCQPAENIISCWWVKLIKLASLITINHRLLSCVVFVVSSVSCSRVVSAAAAAAGQFVTFFKSRQRNTCFASMDRCRTHLHPLAQLCHCDAWSIRQFIFFKNLTQCDWAIKLLNFSMPRNNKFESLTWQTFQVFLQSLFLSHWWLFNPLNSVP
jgi:hypothetical protein